MPRSRPSWNLALRCGLLLASLFHFAFAPLSNSARAAEDSPPRAPRAVSTSIREFRPSDTRPVHNEARLKAAGIAVYESKHLRLHTDIPPELARPLPTLADQAYEALVDYFGPLPPNREGTEFLVTGYVMADKRLFRRVGLLPEDLPEFEHGRHRGAEFWMNDQPYDYYRRHLLIHEFTHCYTLLMPDTRIPVWYAEGIAELFGVHKIGVNNRASFALMPDAKENFAGFRRIEMVREETDARRLRSIDNIARLPSAGFADAQGYAWSWALTKFLDSHPRYRERFRNLVRDMRSGRFSDRFKSVYAPNRADLDTEWALFAATFDYGYDFDRAAIDFQAGRPLSFSPVQFTLRSDRGWQSSGSKVEAGQTYLVTATGRVILDNVPKSWVAEPQGVSILYANRRPLGMVLAAVRSDSPPPRPEAQSMLDVIPIGREARFTPTVSGTLYFRVNDFWNSLANNQGTFTITLQHPPTN